MSTAPVIEEVVRLAPTKDTLVALAYKSGNRCTYPGCPSVMMMQDGILVGQVCHIEAAMPGGERFNKHMTNEQRRHESNLMLMCYTHHQITNDEVIYTVDVLKKMKADHEAKHTDTAKEIERVLRDWTESSPPTLPVNLKRMNRVLGWGNSESELQDNVKQVCEYLQQFRRTPVQVREFLHHVVKRMYLMRDTSVVLNYKHGTPTLLALDFEMAFRWSSEQVSKFGDLLSLYGIGYIDRDEFDRSGDRGLQWGIQIYRFDSGWPFWSEAAEFCDKAGISLQSLAVDLDFSLLDE